MVYVASPYSVPELKVRVLSSADIVMLPRTCRPWPANSRALLLLLKTVYGLMALLKVTETDWSRRTFVAPLSGLTESTIKGEVSEGEPLGVLK